MWAKNGEGEREVGGGRQGGGKQGKNGKWEASSRVKLLVGGLTRENMWEV